MKKSEKFLTEKELLKFGFIEIHDLNGSHFEKDFYNKFLGEVYLHIADNIIHVETSVLCFALSLRKSATKENLDFLARFAQGKKL